MLIYHLCLVVPHHTRHVRVTSSFSVTESRKSCSALALVVALTSFAVPLALCFFYKFRLYFLIFLFLISICFSTIDITIGKEKHKNTKYACLKERERVARPTINRTDEAPKAFDRRHTTFMSVDWLVRWPERPFLFHHRAHLPQFLKNSVMRVCMSSTTLLSHVQCMSVCICTDMLALVEFVWLSLQCACLCGEHTRKLSSAVSSSTLTLISRQHTTTRKLWRPDEALSVCLSSFWSFSSVFILPVTASFPLSLSVYVFLSFSLPLFLRSYQTHLFVICFGCSLKDLCKQSRFLSFSHLPITLSLSLSFFFAFFHRKLRNSEFVMTKVNWWHQSIENYYHNSVALSLFSCNIHFHVQGSSFIEFVSFNTEIILNLIHWHYRYFSLLSFALTDVIIFNLILLFCSLLCGVHIQIKVLNHQTTDSQFIQWINHTTIITFSTSFEAGNGFLPCFFWRHFCC